MSDSRGRAALVTLVLLAGILVSAANVLLFASSLHRLAAIDPVGSPLEAVPVAYQRDPSSFLPLAIVPIVAAVLLALIIAVRLKRPAAGTAAPVRPVAERAPASPDAALRLLAILQREGRFIDFIEEDLDGYDDTQVGAAVRSIHEGCRKAIRERIQIERIYGQEDGAEVEVRDYDPAEVRLTGNVYGQPPFRGILQHGGWRATKISLPEPSSRLNASILEPAEVEIP